MSNRRRHPYDNDDDSDIEQQALLNTLNESNHEGYLGQNRGPIARGTQATIVFGQSNLHSNTSAEFNIDGSREGSSSQLVSPNDVRSSDYVSSHSQLGPSKRNHGDTYELSGFSASSSNTEAYLIETDDIRYKQPANYIYYTIQPGDTLQNLSVRYSCPVASIKRLNNLWSDLEFFGLSKIKLPLGRLRLLADVIDGGEQPNASSEGVAHDSELKSAREFMHHDVSPLLTSQGGSDTRGHKESPRGLDPEIRQTNLHNEDWMRTISLFKNLDTSIESAKKAARSYNDNASAIMQTLAQTGNIVDASDFEEKNNPARREAELPLNDLSDFGLSYNFLLLFIFIICLICPLAYVIYLEETHHRDTHAHPHEHLHEVITKHEDGDSSIYAHHHEP